MRSPVNASPTPSRVSTHDSGASVVRYTFTARDFHSLLFAGFAGALIMSFSDCGFPVNGYAMIRRRAAAAGIETKLGNHSFRATGITAYLKNGGTLEKAAAMANHASTRTTQLYDRRRDEVSLDEVERIVIRSSRTESGQSVEEQVRKEWRPARAECQPLSGNSYGLRQTAAIQQCKRRPVVSRS